MNCAELDILLADYVDGTLTPSERAAVDQHVSLCAGCRQLFEDVLEGAAVLRQAEEVLPPPELITRIAFQAPVGKTRSPFERQGLLSRFATKYLQPVLQPRLAMGMAMTLLSFAMLERCTGVRVQQVSAAELNPVRIWGGVEDKAIRLKDRAVKYYDNLRWVYEIETRLRALQQQDAAAPNSATSPGRSDAQKTTNNSGAGAPDGGNQK